MKKTLYYNPLATYLFRLLTWFILKLTGWKFEGEIIPEKKAILVTAPHSSNWDLMFLLLATFKFRLKIFYLMKAEVFRFPFKWIIFKSGGIPVQRKTANSLVLDVAKRIAEEEEIFLAIAPEGTRSPEAEWKTGFYHIAMKAKVPLQIGTINYYHKTIYLNSYYPVGHAETDIAAIKKICEAGCRKEDAALRRIKEKQEGKGKK